MSRLGFGVALSDSCNMNCSYCFLKINNKPKASYEMLSRILKVLADKSGENKVELLFAYAEPLTEFENMRKLVEESEQYGDKFRFYGLTNGSLLDDEKANWLRKHKQVRLNFSLDGDFEGNKCRVSKGNKSFYEIVDVEKLFAENKDIIWGITCTISPYNIKDFYGHFLFMVDTLEVKRIHFTLYVGEGWTEQELKNADIELEKVHKEFVRRYGTEHQIDLMDKKGDFSREFKGDVDFPPCETHIDAEGDIYFCCTTSLLKDDNYIIGNIFDENIDLGFKMRKKCKMALTKYLCPGVISFGGIPKSLDMKFIGIWEKWREKTSRFLNE